jgi:fumarate hydratase subunit beta
VLFRSESPAIPNGEQLPCLNHHAVYLVAVGGAAALLSKCVITLKVVAWPDLSTEAVHRLELRDFPCYVAVI